MGPGHRSVNVGDVIVALFFLGFGALAGFDAAKRVAKDNPININQYSYKKGFDAGILVIANYDRERQGLKPFKTIKEFDESLDIESKNLKGAIEILERIERERNIQEERDKNIQSRGPNKE